MSRFIDEWLDKATRITRNPTPRFAPARLWQRVLQAAYCLRLYHLPGTPHCITYDTSLKMWVHPRDHITERLVFGGYHEFNEENFVRCFLQPDMVVFDVGANVGLYTLLSAKPVGWTGQVCAFEPEPRNYELLRRNVATNGFSAFVVCERVAVSDVQGCVVDLACSPSNSGATWVTTSPGRCQPTTHADAQESAVTVTLDDYVADHGIARVDFLKLDVEGCESRVVRGAREVLSRCRPVVLCEFEDRALTRAQASVAELWKAFAEVGYEFASYTHSRREFSRQLGPPGDSVTLVGAGDIRALAERLECSFRVGK